MINQFSKNVSEILSFSREEAERLDNKAVGPEHILLAILRKTSKEIQNMINKLKLNIQEIKKELEDQAQSNDILDKIDVPTNDIILNENAGNILKLAVLEARSQHQQIVDINHIVLAILHDKVNNGAKIVLENNNIDYDIANSYLKPQSSIVRNGLELSEDDEELDPFFQNNNKAQHTQQRTKKQKTPVLDNFGVDLTQAAKEGKLDKVIGREKEIQRLCEILGRRKKNNPILIGEPGVGKSAIVEGLAELINKKNIYPLLATKRIISIDMTAIVAGTKYRGQFEERIKALLKELEQNPDIIIFIDEIHTLIGAGSTPGSMDAANILKPALARGAIQCIGATTLDEYRKSIEKDGALERRFQKIIVEQTTKKETLEILKNIKDKYQDHHHVTYTDTALNACIQLTERYVNDRFFPDKAIDVMDEVGSRIHLLNAKIPQSLINIQKDIEILNNKKSEAVKQQNFELAANLRDKQCNLDEKLKEEQEKWLKSENSEKITITRDNVADVIATMTGIPVQRIQEKEGEKLKALSKKLKSQVIAQDKAIDKIVKAIQRNRIGLKDPDKPIGAFMFLGPTGVGKTYLAKKLAELVFGSKDSLIRIDMSEYNESFNTSRLVGAPPGYVGYDEGGQLTEKVRRHPYSIVLLDEIEKAHNNVYNLLLQVLDEGRLTDGNGRLIDFRNTIIIMTSNTGTKQLKDFAQKIGFTNSYTQSYSHSEEEKQRARDIIQKSLSKQFAPEFLNRLDEIITFDQLDLTAIKQIVDIELSTLFKRINKLGYNITITEDAKEFIAKKGYDVQYGARPLKRAIQNYIEDEISNKIIEGNIQNDQAINIDLDKKSKKLSFNI